MDDELADVRVRAMLCRFAELSDHGLTVVGAGMDRVVIPPMAGPAGPLYLGVMVSVPWTETNKKHPLVIEMIHEAGSSDARKIPINLGPQTWLRPEDPDRGKIHLTINEGRPAQMEPGEERTRPLAIPLQPSEASDRPLPGPGVYSITFTVDGKERERVRFKAIAVEVIGFTAQ